MIVTIRPWLTLLLTSLALACSSNSLLGQDQPPPALKDLINAVVKVTAEVSAKARTARFLGTFREGSGVVIDRDGLILTIGYLILEAHKIEVRDHTGKTHPAKLVAYDSATGFGLVRSFGKLDSLPIPIGDSDALKTRDPVLLISEDRSAGFHSAVVASRRTFAGYWEYLLEKAIFTVPISKNFAGAALLSSDYKLVGIGSLAVRDPIPGADQIPGNMFIPINALKPILPAMVATGGSGKPPRPWAGMTLAEEHGRVFVARLTNKGPAEKAGLRVGDIILKVSKQTVGDMESLYREVFKLGNAGVGIPLLILQGPEIQQITIQSADRGKYYRAIPTQ